MSAPIVRAEARKSNIRVGNTTEDSPSPASSRNVASEADIAHIFHFIIPHPSLHPTRPSLPHMLLAPHTTLHASAKESAPPVREQYYRPSAENFKWLTNAESDLKIEMP